MKQIIVLLLILIAGCSPKTEFDCCQMAMSAGELETNIMVCNTIATGPPITEIDGINYMTFYDMDKYKCVCEDKKLDDFVFTVPAGNYTKEEPFKINLFQNCDAEGK